MNKEIKYVSPFKKLCITVGNLPTAYIESMSYYEGLTFLVNYLSNNVIPALNNNGQVVNELKDYVENYFENLDVQKEINNKLDEMAESGVLQDIITSYLQVSGVLAYDTVADMKVADNLIDGSIVKTLGFHEINDGGSANYKIREVVNTDIIDEKFIIALNDINLIAELIIDKSINIKQLGARSYDENHNKVDSKEFIDSYLSYINDKNSSIELYIPSGVYFFSETEFSTSHFKIKGDTQFSLYEMKGTVIAPLNNNQQYIWSIGNTLNDTKDIYLENLYFTGYNITYNISNYYKTNIEDIYSCDTLLKMTRVFGGFTNNLLFMFFKGKALELSSVFEINFKFLSFRHGQNINGCILNFDDAVAGQNISACNFDKIMFEAMHGDLINVSAGANFGNNYIGVINFEDYAYKYGDSDSGTYTNIDGSYNDGTATHHSIINIEEAAQFSCEINSIELNQFSYRYYTLNTQQYIYDTIINCNYSQYIDLIVNNINITGINKNARVIKQNSENFGLLSNFIFNNIQTDSKDYICYFDTVGLTNIKINNNINKLQNTPKLIYNEFIDYRTNILQTINSKNRGNVKYESDSINKNKLCVSMINPTTYSTQPRLEIKIPVTGSKLHLRAKSSNSNQFTLVADIKNGSTLIANKYFASTGSNTFTWYTIDYSTVADFVSGDKGNYVCEFYSSNSTNCNIILDSFFWE